MGVVLPRSALSAAGSENFRKKLLETFSRIKVTILKNTKRWVFENVSEQYTFVLVNCNNFNSQKSEIELKGPIYSLDKLNESIDKNGVVFNKSDVLNWNDTLSFPALPDEFSAEIFKQLRNFPRIDVNVSDEWRVKPDAELHATSQKILWT